jgi:RNase P/RNase MRP subunit p29
MLGYNFQYRGQTFFDTDFDTVTGQGIVLTNVTWADVQTSDDQNNRQGTHGIEVSPTFMRGRVINIQGTIVANSRPERYTLRQTIVNTFAPEAVPSPDNRGFYDFEFVGDDGNDYVISAKVLNMPSYVQPELGNIMITNFQVQLIAENPFYESKILNQLNHVEGFYGGISFPTKFPVAFDTYGYTANVINGGNWPSPIKTTITANENTGANMRVVRTSNDAYVGVETPMLQGDVLVIDTKNNLITLNGDNVSGDRIPGSTYHFANVGNNEFIVRDDLQRVGDGLAVDVLFEWPDTFI